MPSLDRKNIAVIHCGAMHAQITDQDSLDEWLSSIWEIDILAEVHPFFVSDAVQTHYEPEWKQTMTIIRNNWEEYDGFVVYVPASEVIQCSIAASFILGRLGKPVIFTADPYAGVLTEKNLSLMSNLINGTLMAISEHAGIYTLYDGNVFSPFQLQNIGEHNRMKYIGEPVARIDFGLHIQSELPGRSSLAQPNENLVEDITELADLEVSEPDNTGLRSITATIPIDHIPTITYTVEQNEHPTISCAIGDHHILLPMTEAAFITKLSWVLMNMKDTADMETILLQVMQKNVMGELITEL